MRVGVDNGVCQGLQQCHLADPDLFTLDDEGYSSIGEAKEVPDGHDEQAQLAVDMCPVGALRES